VCDAIQEVIFSFLFLFIFPRRSLFLFTLALKHKCSFPSYVLTSASSLATHCPSKKVDLNTNIDCHHPQNSIVNCLAYQLGITALSTQPYELD
jgi:hypothetical protein